CLAAGAEPAPHQLVGLRGAVVVDHLLVYLAGGERSLLGNLGALVAVLLGEVEVDVGRLLGLLGLLVHHAGVGQRLGRGPGVAGLLGDAHVEAGGLEVPAAGGILVAALLDRLDDQPVEPVLLILGGERIGLLE